MISIKFLQHIWVSQRAGMKDFQSLIWRCNVQNAWMTKQSFPVFLVMIWRCYPKTLAGGTSAELQLMTQRNREPQDKPSVWSGVWCKCFSLIVCFRVYSKGLWHIFQWSCKSLISRYMLDSNPQPNRDYQHQNSLCMNAVPRGMDWITVCWTTTIPRRLTEFSSNERHLCSCLQREKDRSAEKS